MPSRTAGDEDPRPNRRPGRWLGRYALLAVVLGLLPMLALAAPPAERPGQEKVDARLVDQLAISGRANFWVGLEVRADLSAAEGMDWVERGWYVYRALLDTAAASQRDLLADLESRGLQAQAFWINNSIYVRGGSLRDVEALAARPEVARIKADEVYFLPEPPTQVEGVLATDGWGVGWIHAPEVWNQGVDGSGIVVANIDTGVQYTHPQLNNTYRGALDGSDAYNWCDPSNICTGDAPCDNHGHGTHVMGTLSGENYDPALHPKIVGVAPGSAWIACKGCEGSTCSDYALLECAEWVLAPTNRLSGNCGEAGLGDPARRPHVVNNSWGDVGGDDWYLGAVQAWRAAGIFPAFSAGNTSACGSVGSPGDYRDSFASGNLSITGSINPSYSGRGPGVRVLDSVPNTYCKPNIAAPGTSIYSSYLSSSYAYMTGTSMASPHSAGAVALLWDACPELIGQIDVAFQSLELSAGTPPADPCAATTGCADAGCNCTYGAGYLDALAVVETCLSGVQVGSVHGYVRDLETGDPLAGATVSVTSALVDAVLPQAVSDPAGYYTMTLLAGTYGLTAHKEGYYAQTVFPVVVSEGAAAPQDFNLINLWTPVALPNPRPIDWTRFDGAFDPHDNRVYFPGGQTGSASQDPSIWTYDPQENRWTDTGCDLNHPVVNYTVAYVEDDGTGRGEALYVVGGSVTDTLEYIDVVQRFYPSEPGCLVEDVASDPFLGVLSGHVVGAGGVVVVDGTIYYIGGWQVQQEPYFADQTWAYDPLAAPGSRWTEVVGAGLSVPRSFLGAAALGTKIYAMGGFAEFVPSSESTIPTDTVEVLDLTQPELGWQPLAGLPIATAEERAFALADPPLVEAGPPTVVVAGGSQGAGPTADASVYDAIQDLWDVDFPDLNAARRNHAGVYVSACTPDPYDGLPAMWVFGGQMTESEDPPYGQPEYWPLLCPGPITPTAQIEAEPVSGCEPLAVRFSDLSTGVLDRAWNFGDGTPLSDNWRPLHTYAAGHYTATLTVTNTAGSDQINTPVVALAGPLVTFTLTPTTILTNTVVQFQDTSIGGVVSWLWDLGDGTTATLPDPTHVFSEPGVYTVTLTAVDDTGCPATAAQALSVRGLYLRTYLPIIVRND